MYAAVKKKNYLKLQLIENGSNIEDATSDKAGKESIIDEGDSEKTGSDEIGGVIGRGMLHQTSH